MAPSREVRGRYKDVLGLPHIFGGLIRGETILGTMGVRQRGVALVAALGLLVSLGTAEAAAAAKTTTKKKPVATTKKPVATTKKPVATTAASPAGAAPTTAPAPTTPAPTTTPTTSGGSTVTQPIGGGVGF